MRPQSFHRLDWCGSQPLDGLLANIININILALSGATPKSKSYAVPFLHPRIIQRLCGRGRIPYLTTQMPNLIFYREDTWREPRGFPGQFSFSRRGYSKRTNPILSASRFLVSSPLTPLLYHNLGDLSRGFLHFF